jgi:hypothetical protein
MHSRYGSLSKRTVAMDSYRFSRLRGCRIGLPVGRSRAFALLVWKTTSERLIVKLNGGRAPSRLALRASARETRPPLWLHRLMRSGCQFRLP